MCNTRPKNPDDDDNDDDDDNLKTVSVVGPTDV